MCLSAESRLFVVRWWRLPSDCLPYLEHLLTCSSYTFSGFGRDAVELMPGYDCPTYASYLNVTLFVQLVCNTA